MEYKPIQASNLLELYLADGMFLGGFFYDNTNKAQPLEAFTHRGMLVDSQLICQKGVRALFECRYYFVQINPFLLSLPALGIITVCAKLRRGGEQTLFAEEVVQGGFGNNFIKVISVQRNILPAQRRINRKILFFCHK